MHPCLIYDFSIFVCERGLAIKKGYVLTNTPKEIQGIGWSGEMRTLYCTKDIFVHKPHLKIDRRVCPLTMQIKNKFWNYISV